MTNLDFPDLKDMQDTTIADSRVFPKRRRTFIELPELPEFGESDKSQK